MTAYVLCWVDYQEQSVYRSKSVYSDDGEFIDVVEGWYPETVQTSPVVLTKCVSEDEELLGRQAIEKTHASKRKDEDGLRSWTDYFPAKLSDFKEEDVRRGYE